MNLLKLLVVGTVKGSQHWQPSSKVPSRNYRPSYCNTLFPIEKRPCFDLNSVSIEHGNQCHAKMIRSFLYTHYWPREPSVAGLWMSLESPYLDVLTEKYATTGDRLIAFEHLKRTNERKMIGVSVCNKIYPWVPDELEDWAHYTCSQPEKNRMYFIAHCYRSPNFYNKYHLKYIYDVEVLTTSSEVTGQGVGTLLLKTILAQAQELRHPLVQVVASSKYTAKICEKCGMKRAWSMDYSEFVDEKGQRVFFPRRPHHTVAIYIKTNDPTQAPPLPCKPPY